MTRRPSAISKAKSTIPSTTKVQRKPTLNTEEPETSRIEDLRNMIGLKNIRRQRDEGKLTEKEFLKQMRERLKFVVERINPSTFDTGNRVVLPDTNLP